MALIEGARRQEVQVEKFGWSLKWGAESGQEQSVGLGSYSEKRLERVSPFTYRSDWCGLWTERTMAVW